MIRPPGEDETTENIDRDGSSRSGRLRLVVFRGLEVQSHDLPTAGTVVIGRSQTSDIVVDDATVSRRHAELTLEPRLRLTNLSATNGVAVRGNTLSENQSADLRPGDVIDLGSVMLVVQRISSAARPRRLLPHSYFETRVEEECARSERSGDEFAIVRVHLEGNADATFVEETLAGHLRTVDVFASYAPGEYEFLLIDSNAEDAQGILKRVTETLAARKMTLGFGVANYPRDGREPELLIEVACERVNPTAAAPTGAAPPARRTVNDGRMQQVYRLVDRVAPSSISVLLLGETGVGKEVVAHAVHSRSDRATKPFLGLNCAALSESLLESELFGHERGSFTGADRQKIGLFEAAEGGTVFLDEVGELPMAIQVKLLRVLETRQFMRVGGVKYQAFNVRFVSATNRDLEAEIEARNFRQDLFFRLNGITIVIPPLRERVDEIEHLANLFIDDASKQSPRSGRPTLSREALALLKSYHWPGNIRELKNIMERAVLLSGGDRIIAEHLPTEKMLLRVTRPNRPASATPPLPPQRTDREPAPFSDEDIPSTKPFPLPEGVLADERQRIIDALDRCAGNQTQAAKMLGISRRTLVTKLDAYNLPRPRKGLTE